MKDFFIVGCPRSGTTLLQVMLNRHPAIVVPPETKLMVGYHRLPFWIRRRTVRRINHDLRIDLSLDLARRGVATPALFDRLRTQYLERVGRKGEATHFGEKTPEHTARLDWINDCFPGAPIVAMVRDGRDVAASLTRVPWLRCSHRAGALVWSFYMHHISSAQKRGRMPLLIVRFEELVATPEVVLQQVLQHLGLYETSQMDQMIEPLPERDLQAFPERERLWKERALKPIDRSVISGDGGLEPHQRREIASLIGGTLQQWGYDLDERNGREAGVAGGRRIRSVVDAGLTISRLPFPVLAGEVIHRWSQRTLSGVS